MPHRHLPFPSAAAQADPAQADLVQADPVQADPAARDPLAAPEQPDPASAGPPATDAILAQAATAEAADNRSAPDDPSAPDDAPARLSRPLAALVLGALTVILGGFGVWATVHAASLRAQSVQQNAALVDPADTSAVRAQVDAAVQTIFSYSYASTGATRQAAQRLLTGPAIKQYDSLFALVQQQAPAQKLVVVTTVTNSAVELLAGDQARVLLFVNQQDTRAGTGQASYSGAMLAVTAIRQSGQWKIENIDTFT
jgi:Mce-associated membrane protein